MKEFDLGTGNIGSLIKRFSIPCVISMVVAALYNIVDQMGNSVKSTVLALLRDVIIFVPTSIIIATISKSIVTMLWAAVILVIFGEIAWVVIEDSVMKKKMIKK